MRYLGLLCCHSGRIRDPVPLGLIVGIETARWHGILHSRHIDNWHIVYRACVRGTSAIVGRGLASHIRLRRIGGIGAKLSRTGKLRGQVLSVITRIGRCRGVLRGKLIVSKPWLRRERVLRRRIRPCARTCAIVHPTERSQCCWLISARIGPVSWGIARRGRMEPSRGPNAAWKATSRLKSHSSRRWRQS